MRLGCIINIAANSASKLNCQVAVTLSIANHHGSLTIAYRLYLPRAWTDDKPRRTKAHVPPSVRFKTKPQIARWSRSARL
jgi:SRSO17 transposase